MQQLCTVCSRGYLCTAGVLYSAKAVQYSMRLGEIKMEKLLRLHGSCSKCTRRQSASTEKDFLTLAESAGFTTVLVTATHLPRRQLTENSGPLLTAPRDQ